MTYKERQAVQRFAKDLYTQAVSLRYADPVQCKTLLTKSYGLRRASHRDKCCVYAVSPDVYGRLFGGTR